ncbi:hypothetical protein WJX74_011029 [Apatococcus lobatus]|uniref:Glutathione S-transferase n=1 Tax=Apatococcus lobatus TaxID=904363 RepID=A0AAW1S2S0_9CHLO
MAISSFVDGVKKALGQGPETVAPAAATPPPSASDFVDTAPSWAELQKMLEDKQQQLGWRPENPETGPANSGSLKRTFGSDAPPRVKLYRDSAAWCPYCQKVWLQLEEKQIPYTIEKINMRCYGDKPQEYTAKVPSGLLPAMELDGELIIESADVMAALEYAFPDKPLMPAKGTPAHARATALMKLERRLFGAWLQWLCYPRNNENNKKGFLSTMGAVEKELGADPSGPFFMGAKVTLVDCVFAPFLERIVASIAYYKGMYVRGEGRFPNLEAWFEGMEKRSSYLGSRSDFYTHCHDLPPQLGGCCQIPEGEPVSAAVDGEDGRSWHLPLPPLHATSLPEPYSPGEQPERDRLQAAAKLIGNHEAVTRFAARGCGEMGTRAFTAELSDPYAKPGMQHLGSVDAGLRLVAHALLAGAGGLPSVDGQVHLQTAADSSGHHSSADGPATLLAAAYMRDRVGVPRDLPLPAARQFRAHLNWLIDSLS